MEVAIIAAVLASVIGWHVSRAHMSHRGIPVRRGQLRDYRKDRLRHGIRFAALAVLLGLILLLFLIH
jgi:hypothetical protein